MIEDYYDQRDARDALRETDAYIQYENEEFNAEQPRVTFKMWLQDYWRKKNE